jgi:hypothetical protein
MTLVSQELPGHLWWSKQSKLRFLSIGVSFGIFVSCSPRDIGRVLSNDLVKGIEHSHMEVERLCGPVTKVG